MNPRRMTDQQLHDEIVKTLTKPTTTPAFGYLVELRGESEQRWEAAGHDRTCTDGVWWRAYAQAEPHRPDLAPATVGCSCGKGQP